MDQFSILPGESYPWAIQQAAAHCNAMVALIGKEWLTKNEDGRRRIDDARDFLRREIVAALDRRIPVIPVLVQGGSVPERRELPLDMQGFEQLQMLEMTIRGWKRDVHDLIERLRPVMPRMGAGTLSAEGVTPTDRARR